MARFDKKDSFKPELFCHRLFILGPKGIPEATWRDDFGKFGTIFKVNILKDKNTEQEKGNLQFMQCFFSWKITFVCS